MKATPTDINVFIAYARKDTSYLEKLQVYLKPLHRNKTIKIWYDGEIAPGTVWEEQIKTHLHKADIILLLVSANSLASDYFYDKEMSEALERHRQNETIVVPVILSDCIWEITDLAELQALPKDGKPVDDWSKESNAFTDIVRGLNRSIKVIQIRRKEEAKTIEMEQQQKVAEEKKKAEAAQKEPLIIKRSGLAIQAKKEASYINLINEGNVFFLQDKFDTAKEKYEEALSFKSNGKEAKNGIRKCELALDSIKSRTILNLIPLAEPIQTIVDNMVSVKGGIFQMGDAKIAPPVHSVTLSDFQISKYQVTQEQWRTVMGSDPPELKFKGCDKCPVESVSWYDVQGFIIELNSLTGKRFRLPTEAEWEYAARGGNKSNGYQYAGSNTIEGVAWYGKNSNKKIHLVGQKMPNELGLYDMSGNVWEWCSDRYNKDYYSNSPNNNPKGAKFGSLRVLRGGSWGSDINSCRVSDRGNYNTNIRDLNSGFRVAQD